MDLAEVNCVVAFHDCCGIVETVLCAARSNSARPSPSFSMACWACLH